MMHNMNRRSFLKTAGVSIALPILDSKPRLLKAAISPERTRRRMVLIDLPYGLYAQNLFPKKSGFDYKSTPYLDVLQGIRKDFTIISGVSHPDVDGGHYAMKCFLTAAPKPVSSRFKNSISVDQLAAENIGKETRFRSMALTTVAGASLSYSRSGVEIPSESRPSQLYTKMFLDGNTREKQKQIQRLKDGQSVMDTVLEQARRMRKKLGSEDADSLDQYLTAVRETEQSLHKAQAWELKPRPVVEAAVPNDINNTMDLIGRERLMYQMIHLAIQTDSTRLITFASAGAGIPVIEGVTQDYHNLSHHGQDPARLAELKIIELEQLKLFAEFLNKLATTKEEGGTLLDQTMVMLGSDLGNGSSHDNHNLPIILAGGGFRHGQHLAFDQKKNYPLANLFVSMLQRLGVSIDKFASSTGTMSGLDA